MNYRDYLQQLIYKIINPLIHGMIKIGITPNFIQNPKNFPYLCRQVGKNARIEVLCPSRRVFGPTKIGKNL